MSSDVFLVPAAIITSTIAIAFAVWSLRAAYLDHQRNVETLKRFAAIRADALDKAGRSLDPGDLDVDDLVKLLFEMRSLNLADVPSRVIARAGDLVIKQ